MLRLCAWAHYPVIAALREEEDKVRGHERQEGLGGMEAGARCKGSSSSDERWRQTEAGERTSVVGGWESGQYPGKDREGREVCGGGGIDDEKDDCYEHPIEERDLEKAAAHCSNAEERETRGSRMHHGTAARQSA